MGKFSRDKGARGEREFYAELKKILPAELHDKLGRNGNQAASGGADSRESLYPFAIEIKRRKSLNDFTDSVIDGFWLELCRDCKNLVPVLAYKADRQRWKVQIPAFIFRLDFVSNENDPIVVSLKDFAWVLDGAINPKYKSPIPSPLGSSHPLPQKTSGGGFFDGQK